jgi:hypothetical protein
MTLNLNALPGEIRQYRVVVHKTASLLPGLAPRVILHDPGALLILMMGRQWKSPGSGASAGFGPLAVRLPPGVRANWTKYERSPAR